MRRESNPPRPDWERLVEQVGLRHHTAGGVPYWNEEAHYVFSMAEVRRIEEATRELHALCLEAAEAVIVGKRYAELAIPPHAVPLIEASWEADAPSIYGRFDLSYDGRGEPKMLEYNADTPTSLVEAAVAQWYWLEDRFPGADQFNRLHEALVETWDEVRPYLFSGRVHFASMPDAEDEATVEYLRDTAQQAGLETVQLTVEEIGWDPGAREFVDVEGIPLRCVFKLYPWEWMMNEEFGQNLARVRAPVQWMEPAWKMILSNKGILPILWERNPGHPNLLPAYRDDLLFTPADAYVVKPLLSREGANVRIVSPWHTQAETGGDYGEEGFVYQEYAPLPSYDGWQAVIGSWIVGQHPAGMGIRESRGPITDNLSRFVPHLIGSHGDTEAQR
ncbi:MAG TPA: glutathionylspermidine synthase family protein [Longimicrobium sp.]